MEKYINITEPNSIDQSMSLEDVKEYLKATVFSSENIAPSSKMIDAKYLTYKNKYVKWSTEEHGDERYIIYPQLKYEGNHQVALNIIPYWDEKWGLSKIYFCLFYYGKRKCLAHLIGGEIQLYSTHVAKRYAERFCKMSRYSNKSIGRMLIYNQVSYIDTYQFIGRSYSYEIARDGIFNCEQRNGSMIRTTFLNKKKFKLRQVSYYNKCLSMLNEKLKAHKLPPVPRITDASYYMAA